MKQRAWCVLLPLIFTFSLSSQNQHDQFYNKFGLRAYTGSIFVHSDDVENTSGSRPFAIEIEYSKRYKGAEVWNLCRCYPTTGFVLAYHNYDNEIIGNGGHLGYFVQYHFLQRSRLSPYLRGLGGLSYNNNPHHEIHNPDNQSYSLPINFSLQLALGIEAQLAENYFMDVHASFNHISNGGLQQPNKGINWPALGVGIYYSPNFSPLENRDEIIPHKMNTSNWYKRFEGYLSAHSRNFDDKERFPVFGGEFLLGYYLSNLNALNSGIEWNLDLAKSRLIELESKSKTAHRLSVNFGHEFILGDFRFSQKLGIYTFDQLKENDLLYHKWGMVYLHKSGILAGIELKAHRHVAEIIVGKIGLQF